MDSEKKHLPEISTKSSEIISFFEKDAAFVFAYKKTEKLASAVYMVTNLFPESEPMKWTLRKKVSDILSFTVGYKDVRGPTLSDFVYDAKSKVLEIVSLLDVATLGGLISHMNASILKTEFSNLIDIFNSSLSSQKNSSHESINKAFFDIPDAPNLPINRGTFQPSPYSGIKDSNTTPQRDEFKRSNRQNIILGLVKKKKEVTIKDIAQVIKDCSEKTIQRELISFIAAGVLKRTGERRWSKYSLV